MRIVYSWLFGILIILLTYSLPGKVFAQEHQIVSLEDWSYEYIRQLQQRGYLQSLHPARLPYTQKEIRAALQTIDPGTLSTIEADWVSELNDRFEPASEDSDDFNYGLTLRGGITASNSDSLLLLRDIDDRAYLFPSGFLSGYMEKGPLIAQFGLRHNLFYVRDPIGLPAANRIYIRSEDAYVGFQNSYLKLYLGRFQNHWAPIGRASGILGHNARSFDQLNITFGNENVSFQSVLGQLDNISADDLFTGEVPEVGARQRYLSAHRFDWRVTPNIRLTLFESILYSGVSTSLSLKYLNPLQTYYFTENAPKNEDINLLIGGAVWMQFAKKVTVQSQFILDDFDFYGNRERTTFSWFNSIDVAKLFPRVDVGLETEAVAYQTYNAEQAEGRYLYLKRGLATQFNDYIFGSVYANIYAPGLRITPRLSYLAQGEQEINQPIVKTNPDGSLIDITLTGRPERRFRSSLELFYRPHSSLNLYLDLGYTFANDVGHIPGTSESGLNGTFKIQWTLFDIKK